MTNNIDLGAMVVHVQKKHIVCILFLFTFLSVDIAAHSTPVSPRKHAVLTSYDLRRGIVLKKGTIYEIRSEVDLDGKKLVLPTGCILCFKGGYVRNGQLEGNLTDIDCGDYSEAIFRNVSILGSWKCRQIQIDWINYRDNGMIQSILRLQNPDIYQEIIFPDENIEWTPTEEVHWLADIKSNCRVCIKKAIRTKTNSLTSCEVFYINNQSNIIIEGGELIGDCETHIPVKGNTSEGCHGIRVRGGHDITIKNLISRNHNGDGIFVRGTSYSTQTRKSSEEVTNLFISNCLLDNNRRQGISLCAAMNNVIIDSCRIINTGKTNGTAPCAGIDVEPISFWAEIKNLKISNCFFKGNQGQAIDYNGYYYNDNIVIDNCKCEVDGNMVRQSEGILLLGALNNFVIRNSSFPIFNISGNKIKEVSRYPHNAITVEDCFFNLAYISNNQEFSGCDVAFKRCTFDKQDYSFWKNVSTLTLNLPISYSFSDCIIKGGGREDVLCIHKRSVDVCFNNCSVQTVLPFTITKGTYLNNAIDCSFVDIATQGDITLSSNQVKTHSKTQRLRISNIQGRSVTLSDNIIMGINDNIISGNSKRITNLFFKNNKWGDYNSGKSDAGVEKNIRAFFGRSNVDNSVYYDEKIKIEKRDKKNK